MVRGLSVRFIFGGYANNARGILGFVVVLTWVS